MSENHIVVVFHEEVSGGATLSVLRLVPLLEEKGFSFSFWVSRPSPLYDELTALGYDVYGAPRLLAFSREALRLNPGTRRRLLSLPGYAGEFARALRRRRPALVHANSLFALPEALIARAARIPTVFHVHEMVPPGRKGQLAKRLAFGSGAEVLAVSSASADQLSLRERRPHIVYEAAPYPAAPASRHDGVTTVGTVGVISKRKGSDIFVEAAGLVKEAAPEIEFEMIGAPTDVLDEEWAGGVLEEAARLGVRHTMKADVPKAMSGWDIFALPSRWDPFPISLLEAMGSGLAVIGSDVDGIPEQLAGGSGVVIQGGNPFALASAILNLHRHHDERATLGRAARSRALECFTLDGQATGVAQAYGRALARRGKRHVT